MAAGGSNQTVQSLQSQVNDPHFWANIEELQQFILQECKREQLKAPVDLEDSQNFGCIEFGKRCSDNPSDDFETNGSASKNTHDEDEVNRR